MRSVKFILLYLFSGILFKADAVVLSEIMFNPNGAESSDEYIELYNESSLPLNLSDWTISDGEGIDTLVSTGMGLMAAPRQYVVILDPDYFEEESFSYDDLIPGSALVVTIDNSTFGSRGLSNSTAETVSIMQPNENVVAEYTYNIDIDAGHSNEKILMNGGDEIDNWGQSLSINGTPGFRNSITPPDFDLAIHRFEADPVVPEAGETVEFKITVQNLGLNTASDSLFLNELDSPQGSMITHIMSWQIPLLSNGDTVEFIHSFHINDEGGKFFEARLATDDDESDNNAANLILGTTVSEGSVLINEIMCQPLAGNCEWIELVNTGSTPVVMNGWTFSDGTGLADSSKRFIIESVILDTNSYLLLASDSTIFLEDLPEDLEVLVWNSSYPSLNNAGDSLVLADGQENIIDRVDYRAEWGNSAAGFSLERVSVNSISNDPLNWASSLDPTGATPGRKNSRALPEYAENENLIVLEPNPFSPDGDGHDDVLAIRYHLNEADSRLDIKIFDVRGRQVRYLSNNLPAGYYGEILWDGKSDSGRLLPTGMYIVYLEALGQGGNRIQTGRRVVALARPS